MAMDSINCSRDYLNDDSNNKQYLNDIFLDYVDLNFAKKIKKEINALDHLLFNYLENIPLNERLNSDILIDESVFTVEREPEPVKEHDIEFNIYKKMQNVFSLNQEQLECLKRRKILIKPKQKLKYYKFVWMEPRFFIDNPILSESSDIIFHIHIYKSTISSIVRNGSLNIDQIIAIRGSQTLKELRDMILCAEDFSCPKDISEDPSALIRGQRNEFNSSIFFIENIIYIDRRNEGMESEMVKNILLNYSAGQKNPISFEYFDSMTLDKIKFKFGQAYYFKHQATCEHKICFSDVRYSYNEKASTPVYPYNAVVVPKQSKSCYLCGIYLAKWMITQSQRIFTDPSFACDDCFSSYFYIGRKKLENFKAFEYNDPVLSNFNYNQLPISINNFQFGPEENET